MELGGHCEASQSDERHGLAFTHSNNRFLRDEISFFDEFYCHNHIKDSLDKYIDNIR